MIEAQDSSVFSEKTDGPSAEEKGETAEEKFQGRKKFFWDVCRICSVLSHMWSAIVGF